MIHSHYQKFCLLLKVCFKRHLLLMVACLIGWGSAVAQNYSGSWTQGQRLMPDFTGTLQVANNTSEAVEDYYVEFELDSYFSQVTSYSGTISALGDDRYRWEPPTWGGGALLGANTSVDISINAKYAGISVPPFNVTLHGSNMSTSSFEVTNLSPLFPSPCGQPQCNPASGYDPSKKIIAYYISWGVYGRNFHVQDLRADKMTHINFAFANIDPSSYRIVVGDEFADLQKEGGSFDKLYQLKQYYPHLKTLISVGGWTWSTHFYEAAATAANRQAFAESVREFLVKYKFDGVDLDWEYPGGGGNDAGKGGPEDGANYTKLVQAIRAELEAQKAIDSKDYLITAAVGAGTSKINAMDVPGFFSAVDWANIMTYDMNGAWANYTGHHAPLYNSAGGGKGTHPDGTPIIDPKFNVHTAITHYINDGAPANKITMGLPIYSREWRNVQAGDAHGLYQPSTASQPPPGSWDEPGQPSGVHDYKDLVASYINKNGYTRHWDDEAQVPYLYNPNQMGGHFISYEDTESLGYKINYIHQNNLAGAMYWEATQDIAPGSNSLIDKIYADVMAGGCAPNCPNTPPTANISSPANNSDFILGQEINISAQASDPDSDGTVVRVEFFAGVVSLGEDTSAPYSITWSEAPLGTHNLTAVATDNEGASTTSGGVVITVKEEGGNDSPTVDIVSPADGAEFEEGTTVTIEAIADDSDGTIASVEFFEGSNKLGEVTSEPYKLLWNGGLAGSYSLTARATDNEGATSTSSAVAITITTSGGDCNGIPQYVAGTSYSQDQEVKNVNNRYTCDVPGWCSSAAAWAYEPGVGQHWQDAWSLAGSCSDVGDNQVPSVSITSPTNTEVFEEGDDITFSASADDDGEVVQVVYYQGTTQIGSSATSPYEVIWNNVAAGSYSVVARATDDEGVVGSSVTITVTVNSTGGGDCGGLPVWSSSTVYYGGDQVQYNGNKYQANYWTQNNNPETNSEPYQHWANLGPCGEDPNVRRTNSTMSSIKSASDKNRVSDFALEQNYPNPFTEFTTITFSLPERSGVSLTVYNSRGEEVMKLVDQTLKAGKHTLKVNTTPWAGGLYHYQLSAGFRTRTLKMYKK